MSKEPRKRLDTLLVELGLCVSQPQAQSMIMQGLVWVNEKKIDKSGTPVLKTDYIEVLASQPKYVSRAGEKLLGALEAFSISVKNWVCLDVGSSTGGFMDCLLQQQAKHVYGIDVGTHQLHEKLRTDKRVTFKENFHVKDLTPQTFNTQVDLATIDVSFISLKQVLPFVLPVVKKGGHVLALIKPQFEASPKDLIKGIIESQTKRQEIIDDLLTFAKQQNLQNIQFQDAVIKGTKGNLEGFLFAQV